jgi:hypothetical protein
MADYFPVNALDDALRALQRSVSATPALYRALIEGELYVLLPYHPEVEGESLELKNGMPCPFIVINDQKGEIVMVFSSLERAEEGMKRDGIPDNQYVPAAMPARQLLQALGAMGLRAVVNKSCTTGLVVIPPDLMRDLADGSALKPPANAEPREQFRARVVPPAEYPTDLIQPVFEVLRQHRNFRAAWICDRTPEGTPPGQRRTYGLMFLMQPRDEKIFHDVNMIVQAARRRTGHEVYLGLLDETDTAYIAALFKQAAPFYLATDYQPPTAR